MITQLLTLKREANKVIVTIRKLDMIENGE